MQNSPVRFEHRVVIPSLSYIDFDVLGEIKYAHIKHQIRYDLWKNISLEIKVWRNLNRTSEMTIWFKSPRVMVRMFSFILLLWFMSLLPGKYDMLLNRTWSCRFRIPLRIISIFNDDLYGIVWSCILRDEYLNELQWVKRWMNLINIFNKTHRINVT